MPKKNLSKFAVSSGQELTIKDERHGYDHHSNFVHLEYVGYNANNKSKESDKFWQGWTEGPTFMYRFGARGTKGQTRPRACSSTRAAKQLLDTKVREKLREDYKNVEG